MRSQQRAQLFLALTRLSEAGLPPESTLQRASEQAPEFAVALRRTRSLVQAGHAFAGAGQASDLFRNWEARLLAAAEKSGNVPTVLLTLSRYYDRRSAQLQLIRARLAYPAAIVALGLFIAPLPALVQGTLSVSGYLLRSLGILVIGALIFRTIARASEQQRERDSSRAWANVQLALPLVGRHARLHNQVDYLTMLSMALRAGLPALEAAQTAADGLSNSLLAELYRGVSARLADGERLSVALAETDALQDDAVLPLIDSGESAGNLDESIAHAAELLQQRLDQWHKNVTDWLPRIIYFMVLAVVAAGFL